MKEVIWALIGNEHISKYSIAKQLWEKIFQIKNINCNFLYINSNKKKEIFERTNNILEKENLIGFNIAMPWKNFFFNKCEKIEIEAIPVKTINTIIKKDSSLYGLNSDGKALYNLIKGNINIKNKKFLILGAGGAIQTLPYFLIKDEIFEIFFYDINIKKIEILQSIYGKDKIKSILFENIPNILKNLNLFVWSVL